MLNVMHIVQSGGLVLLGLFLFAEVGLFLGFFLPGDTLLIAAGIYAKQGNMNLAAIFVVAAIAAILGDNTAFFIGHAIGPRLFRNDDAVIFRKEHLEKASKFYDRWGSKTVLIAHYIAVVRTFSPLAAGTAGMPWKKYLLFDIIGDASWAVLVTLVGYYVGSRIPNVDNYILLVLFAVVVASVAPTLYHVVRLTLKKRQASKAKKS